MAVAATLPRFSIAFSVPLYPLRETASILPLMSDRSVRAHVPDMIPGRLHQHVIPLQWRYWLLFFEKNNKIFDCFGSLNSHQILFFGILVRPHHKPFFHQFQFRNQYLRISSQRVVPIEHFYVKILGIFWNILLFYWLVSMIKLLLSLDFSIILLCELIYWLLYFSQEIIFCKFGVSLSCE